MLLFGRKHSVDAEDSMKHLLTDISGIGESTAARLSEYGIDSVKALRKAGVKKLCRVPGFGEIRAAATVAAADRLKDADKSTRKKVVKAGKKARKPGKDAKKTGKVTGKKAASSDKSEKGKKSSGSGKSKKSKKKKK